MTAKLNLIVDQGSSFYQEINLFDQNGDKLVVNVANGDPIYNAASQMRKSYQASNSVTFDTALSNGMLVISLEANDTVNIVSGRYVYSTDLIGANSTTRIIEGIVTVKPTAIK